MWQQYVADIRLIDISLLLLPIPELTAEL
jgi:hypothetical protein